MLGTNGAARLQPIEPGILQLELAQAAGSYAKGPQRIELPPYRRYEGELAELASAIDQRRSLAVSHAEEVDIQETLLRASEMLL